MSSCFYINIPFILNFLNYTIFTLNLVDWLKHAVQTYKFKSILADFIYRLDHTKKHKIKPYFILSTFGEVSIK